jgi:hypothetical protein
MGIGGPLKSGVLCKDDKHGWTCKLANLVTGSMSGM